MNFLTISKLYSVTSVSLILFSTWIVTRSWLYMGLKGLVLSLLACVILTMATLHVIFTIPQDPSDPRVPQEGESGVLLALLMQFVTIVVALVFGIILVAKSPHTSILSYAVPILGIAAFYGGVVGDGLLCRDQVML